MYDVNYNSRIDVICEKFLLSYLTEGLLDDAERDLSAIAKCLVRCSVNTETSKRMSLKSTSCLLSATARGKCGHLGPRKVLSI